jgi:TRAP-type mannitol/chloroaromatic compound transport system substrate-binding protein
LEMTFNKQTWNRLSNEHKVIIEMASEEMNSKMAYDFHTQNALALAQLQDLGVKLRSFPDDVITAAKVGLEDVIISQSSQNADFKRVFDSASSFLKVSKSYTDVSLKKYLNIR